MATKSAECITDGRKKEQNPEQGRKIGNGYPELCKDNEIAGSDCKSRQSVSVKLVN